MERGIQRFLLIFLGVLSGVRVTEQLPMRVNEKELEPRQIPAADPVMVQEVKPDPLENIGVELSDGFLIEGDIRVMYGLSSRENTGTSDSDGLAFSKGLNSHQTRNSVAGEDTWLERVIPYEIDPTFNSTERQIILDAIREIMAAVNNCTLFVEREKQEDFLYITGQQIGCYSSGVGKAGGNQTISISRASQCVSKGIIMHELLHALGFWHEHNRPDRDKYIEINLQNVLLGHTGEFDINKNGKMLVDYDFYSIMHYKKNQFSKDKISLNTIRILQSGVDESQVGQRSYLSDKDKERILMLYQCKKSLRSLDNLTQSSEYLGVPQNPLSTVKTLPNVSGRTESVRNTQQADNFSEKSSEHSATTMTAAATSLDGNAVKGNFTTTEEIGKK